MPSILLKLIILTKVAVAISWLSIVAVSGSLFENEINVVAYRVSRGERYSVDTLISALNRNSIDRGYYGSVICETNALRSSIIISSRIFEQLLADGDIAKLDDTLSQIDRLARRLLSCSPSDAFGWLAFYWVGTQQASRSIEDGMKLLDHVYIYGPNELWITLRRTYLAMLIFDELPKTIKSKVVSDYVSILRAGAIQEAANILVGAGYAARSELLAATALAPRKSLTMLSKVLEARRSDIEVPDPLNYRSRDR